MKCIDYDIQNCVTGHVKNNRLPGLTFDMVYYADDTIIVSQDNRGLNELLKLTEMISAQYGLRLDKDKCFAIAMNNDGNIHFHDGTPLDKKYETTYKEKSTLEEKTNRDIYERDRGVKKVLTTDNIQAYICG